MVNDKSLHVFYESFFIIWLIERNYKMHFMIMKEYSTSNLDTNSSLKINQNICHAESMKRRKRISVNNVRFVASYRKVKASNSRTNDKLSSTANGTKS